MAEKGSRQYKKEEITLTDNMSKDEKIGFHKGSVSTLVKERQELAKLVGIVDQLIQMHVSALKELGVDINKQAETGKLEEKVR